MRVCGAQVLLHVPVNQVHCRAADKSGNEGIGWPVIDFGWAADLLHNTFFHNHNTVSQVIASIWSWVTYTVVTASSCDRF